MSSTDYVGLRLVLLLGLTIVLAAGCRQDMHDGPRYEPLQETAFFADRRASRPLVAGTVARGHLRDDDLLYTGRIDGELAADMPFPIDRALLERGRERYNIYCTPCHDSAGTGQGMIVMRGFQPPLTFHSARLREMPVGHFYDAITNGFGVMPDYRDQIPVLDRWAIVAYVRALQLSQWADLEDVPAGERPEVAAPGAGSAAGRTEP